jgi:hypothetical protein
MIAGLLTGQEKRATVATQTTAGDGVRAGVESITHGRLIA